MRTLTWLVTNTLAVAVAAWLVDGIRFTGPGGLADNWVTVLAVGVILGVVSVFVKPVVQVLSLPFILVTLGLFLWVINAGMLMLTSWLAEVFGLDFVVRDFFWAALLGALVISVVNWLVDSVLGRG